MTNKKERIGNRLKSKEVEKELKISSCDLMHLRDAGQLNYVKNGNAFLYSINDVEKLKGNVKRG